MKMQCKDLPDQLMLAFIQQYEGAPGRELVRMGVPRGVACRKLEKLCDRGWLDYGVNVMSSFLTPVGYDELESPTPLKVTTAQIQEIVDARVSA